VSDDEALVEDQVDEMAGIDALREGGSAAKEEGAGAVKGAKKALKRD
jgi:hypothetical protein